MFEVFTLLVACTAIAFLYTNSMVRRTDGEGLSTYKPTSMSNVLFAILLIIMVLFAGLRTTMNDTVNYMGNFERNDLTPTGWAGILKIDLKIGSNPLFNLYKIIIKTVISKDPRVFILITSAIVETSYLLFLKKYSPDFGVSVFTFIAFAVYGFTMAAMKQTLAVAIGVWAVPALIDKRYVKAIIILILAALIHPYVVLFGCTVLFYKSTMDRRTVLLLIGTAVFAAFFQQIMEGIFSITSSMGDEYSFDSFGNKISLGRALAYSIVPVCAFFSKHEIREKHNPIYNVCVNFSVLSMCIVLIARLGGAILIGRMANYFDIFTCISVPVVLKSVAKKGDRSIVTLLVYACLIYYYYTYYIKFATGYGAGMWGCIFSHTSLFDILFGGM